MQHHDYNHSLPLPAFDREQGLEELLSGIDRNKLMQCLGQMLESPVRLVSANRKFTIGDELETTGISLPVRTELEPVAYLETEVDAGGRLSAAVSVIEMLLRSSARYLMASDLHLEAVRTDYEELGKKHEQLVLSEQKYKQLSHNLELRVSQQVKTIEDAQRRLYEAEKMASVGQLAAGVAHEINNPMAFVCSNLIASQEYVDTITSFGELIKLGVSREELTDAWKNKDLDFILSDFHSLLDESSDGAKRITEIVKNLKDFSNVDGAEEEIADINAIIRSVCSISHGVNDDIELDMQLGELPETRCQPGYLGQVLLNIMKNAELAINKKGKIIVHTSCEDSRIIVSISDTGSGMTDDVAARIFEPFYTTREVGHGTGLGLTVSRDIIQAHGGEIHVESKQDQGTTVTVVLPVITRDTEAS